MINKTKLTLGSLFLLLPSVASAQIVYAPGGPGQAVPTLTTTTLLLSIVLLFIAAKFAGFDRAKVSKTAGVLAVCAVASGAFSIKLISDVYADGGGTSFSFFDSPTGGSVPINNGVLNIFENTAGAELLLVSITLGACPDSDNGSIEGIEQCEEGDIVSTGEDGLCYTDCRIPVD